MKLPTLLIAALLATGSVVSADEPRPVADDPRVADAVAAFSAWAGHHLGVTGVPGASVALVHDQELLYAAGFGMADPESGRPAGPDTVYSICSISKLFTSIAVMQLRDADRLELDDPVGEHLDWFAALADEHPGDEPVTLRRVLTHSAGLPRESDSPYWNVPFDFPSREAVRERLASQHTLYPSGRYFQYSNLGLTLLGEVVAEVGGRSWEETVEADILEPLGMADTFTTIPAARATGRMAVGYSARRGSPERERLGEFDVAGIGPAAGMASTVEDLARFASWQLRLWQDGGDEVLRAATLREMQRVHWVDPDWDTTWGLGFSVRRQGDRTVVGHGGGCPGYYSSFAVVPAEGFAAVVMSNAIGAEVGLIASKAIEIVSPAVQAAVDSPDDVPERDPALDRYVGTYDTVWGRIAIVRFKDGLATVDLHTRSPEEGIDPLRKVGENSFRRVRDDDGSLGEEWRFEVGEDGRATRVQVHSIWYTRVE